MKKTKLCITLTVAIFISTTLFSQEYDWPCEETVHGIVDDIHMDCTNQDILVTSFQEDSNGTIVSGVITTLGGIIIKPGHSFVEITANRDEQIGVQTHGTTRIGSNANVGRYKDISKTKGVDEIIVYSNITNHFITIRSTLSKITNYQITNFYGAIIKKEKLSSTNHTKLSVLDIKKGIYLLTIQLEN